MELIGYNESPIKIKRTIFNMEPRIEKTTKISRNMDSGQTQLQQLGTLLHTLLRLEALRVNAYDRWQPYFNEGKLDFPGLVAYLGVFHNDHKILDKLETFYKERQSALQRLRKNPEDHKFMKKLQECKSYGMELMEEIRTKIYALQIPQSEFQSYSVR